MAGIAGQDKLNGIFNYLSEGRRWQDVARRFKVSRSLLEMRFRALQRESVYEAMLRIRLADVKRRLRQTKDPISEITAACGWKNPTPPKMLFKKRFGISMRDWRQGRD